MNNKLKIIKEVTNKRIVKLGQIRSNLIIRIPVDFSNILNLKEGDEIKMKVIDKNKIELIK